MNDRLAAGSLLRTAWSGVLDFLFPARCVGCGRFGGLLCTPCAASFRPASGSGRCGHCAAAWEGTGNCPRCFGLDALDGVRAAVEMTGAARKLVHALKYGGVTAAVPLLGSRLAPVLATTDVAAVFPVPLHRSRRRARGFNQAELLAAAVGVGAAPGRLLRVQRTATQVGQRLRERRANVAGAFAYEGPPLAGLPVAILDDVVTTGSTANECARVLREHGAGRVVAVAFARASYSPGSTDPIRD
ncbi:MAG: ComF family protein [Dehalococcoidia bacterium]|nr:ComF family protein [Dehalococcoidia bacterium]